MIVPILLSSISLALCNRLDSRAETLFTTASYTHTSPLLTIGFHFACTVHNFAVYDDDDHTSVKFPSRVCPPPRDNRVPSRVGGSQMAGGSRESHLTIKQTGDDTFTCFTTTTHTSISTLTFTTIRLNQLNLLDGLFRLNVLNLLVVLVLFTVVPAIAVWFTGNFHTFAFTSFIRRAHDSSGKILSFRGLRAQPRYKRMAEKEPTTLDGLYGSNFTHPLYLLPLPRFWISIFGIELGHFMPFTSWISIFGIELRLSLPCLDWMSTGFA